MKIRDKILTINTATLILSLIISGIIVFVVVNAEFNRFVSEQLEFLQPYMSGGPRVRVILDQMQEYKALIQAFNKNIVLLVISSSVIGLIIGFFTSFYLSERLTRPLKKLKENIASMRKHDYSSKFKPEGSDEIADVAKEFEQLRIELARVENLRKELVSDLAHELNTPITTINGIVEGVEEGVYDVEKKQFLKIKNQIQTLSFLINQMRHFNHIRTKDYQSSREKFDIKNLIEDLLTSFKDEDIDFEIDKSISLNTNKVALSEVLNNLISNAVKYGKSQKPIRVIVKDDKENVTIKVKDFGKGISKEDQKLIFERFFRVDKSRNKKSGGIGLGLAIVKEISDSLGWEIDLQSKINEGSEFILTIPHN